MNIFIKFKAYLRFKEAIRQAEEKLKSTGQRHYVLRGRFCELVVTDRKNYRGMRMKHYISDAEAKIADVVERCLYHTSYRDGVGAMSVEELDKRMNKYYDWYESARREKRIYKRQQRKKRREMRKKIRQKRKEVRYDK